MELLIAFFIATGIVNNLEEGKKLSEEEAKMILAKDQELEKEFVIWEAEGDDF